MLMIIDNDVGWISAYEGEEEEHLSPLGIREGHQAFHGSIRHHFHLHPCRHQQHFCRKTRMKKKGFCNYRVMGPWDCCPGWYALALSKPPNRGPTQTAKMEEKTSQTFCVQWV